MFPSYKIINQAKQFALLLTILLISCLPQKTSKKDDDRDRLKKNKVKTSHEFVTQNHSGKKLKEYINRVKTFDTEGKLSNEIIYSPDGTVDFFAIHSYDKNGNLVLTEAWKADSSFFYKNTYIYDENNNMLEKSHFEDPGENFFYKNTAAYDSKGRMTEYYWYRPTGLRAKNVFKYNGMLKIENKETDLDGNLTSLWLYKYDNKENLIESIQYYPDSIINSRIIYEYDDADQKIKQTDYHRGVLDKEIELTYDEKKMLSQKVEYAFGEKTSSAIYRYEYTHY